MMAMPVPVVHGRQENAADLSRAIPAGSRRSAASRLQARISGYIDAQPATDGADVKSGDLLYKIDPRDLQAALDQARAQAQRDAGLAGIRARPISRAAQELMKSGYVTKDAFDQRSSAMRGAEAALAVDQAAIDGGDAQPRLRRNPRAFRRPARAQPRRQRRARRPGDRRAQYAGSARSRLCHLQPERVRTGGDRDGARGRQSRGGGLDARRARA